MVRSTRMFELLPLRRGTRAEMTSRELLRRFAGGLRGALHLLAVLVGAGEHHGIVPLHALEARDGLGGHGGVRVADVGRGIHVVEREW